MPVIHHFPQTSLPLSQGDGINGGDPYLSHAPSLSAAKITPCVFHKTWASDVGKGHGWTFSTAC